MASSSSHSISPTKYSATSPTILPPPPSPGRRRTNSRASGSNDGSGSDNWDKLIRSPRIQSSPILLKPLPATSSLTKESIYASELELDKQIKQVKKEVLLKEALQEQLFSVERLKIKNEQGNWSNLQKQKQINSKKGKESDDSDFGSWGKSKKFVNEPQAFELYKAIDKHDLEYIMRIRDHKFNLLLQKNGGNEFPIVYTTRLGDQYRDIVILLVGALSRYVNHLDPEDFEKKETLRTLKALRANLKLAIDHTLNNLPPGHSPILLSSYLQVLIMSEGDQFLIKSINEISLLLKSSIIYNHNDEENIKPVKSSEEIIRKFCTKELRGIKNGVFDVEEYIANSILDLILMSCWNLVATQLNLDNLPTHTFARDLRTYTIFSEYIETNQELINQKLNPKLKKILYSLNDVAGNSKKSIRGRLNDVRLIIDHDHE
ncbi:uncharacterized protein L201_007046 [Kwoniella dendrophila CBS 6074]|uniref:GBD/FH3 domain-containing protein n=1 Tax=Kwoniella dendrophila CBS 6074 TaxID=1295534 RepID=A0AAX4K3F9_9TREE